MPDEWYMSASVWACAAALIALIVWLIKMIIGEREYNDQLAHPRRVAHEDSSEPWVLGNRSCTEHHRKTEEKQRRAPPKN